MEEIKEELNSLKQSLPMIKQLGGIDDGALKVITESIDEILVLCDINKLKQTKK